MLTNSTKSFFAGRIALVLVAILAAVSGADAATATWDANTELDVAGYRLSYGTQPGVHGTTIDVGKVTTYQFNPPAGARYYVVVQAYNAAGLLSEKSAEAIVDVPLANRAPSLAQPANQTTILNAHASLALAASDPDGGPLAFAAAGFPPGLSIDAASGNITGIALAAGTYAVTVGVTDGSLWAARTFTWTVTGSTPVVVDLKPLDTTLMANHGNNSAAEWLLAYTWPANRALAVVLMKFNLASIPANAAIQSASLNMFLTGADANTADPNYTLSLHQVLSRNPDITRATGWLASASSAWTANDCCHARFPMAQADVSPARSATVVNRTLGIKTWDATAIARAWLSSPAANYGLLLNPDLSKGSDRFRVFGSMQDPSSARRPFLRVTYTVPAAAATSVTTLAAGEPETPAYLRVDGDFDGDGRPELGTFRSADAEWRLWTSRSNFAASIRGVWGMSGDLPVPADYDGDSVTDIAIYRPSTGDWHIWLSGSREPLILHWGAAADRPAAFDADGDGKADLALIRGSGYDVLLSSTNYSSSVRTQ
jgi:Putative Ig domain